MKVKIIVSFLLSCIFQITESKAQNFINGDLDGTVNGIASLPNNWLSVPYNDPVCLASYSPCATPDLTNLTGPDSANGISGYPYSGLTFVSGVYGAPVPSAVWHEGIMQYVSGFTINQVYTIHFYQSVVKQTNTLDTSGSWAVYIDNALAGVTTPTISQLSFNNVALAWEAKSISFTATSVTHLIKFLPMDDDTNHVDSESDENGALRMGIDSIGIDVATGIIENNSDQSTIFPNPFNQFTTLKLANYQKGNYNLILYDIHGHVARTICNINTNEVKIERQDLSPGLYFFTLSTANRVIDKGKLVVE